MAYGKSGNPDYVHLGARIPRRLKAQFKSKIALLELDSSETVITSKDLETVGLQNIPEAIPQAAPQPSPVSPKPKKPRKT